MGSHKLFWVRILVARPDVSFLALVLCVQRPLSLVSVSFLVLFKLAYVFFAPVLCSPDFRS